MRYFSQAAILSALLLLPFSVQAQECHDDGRRGHGVTAISGELTLIGTENATFVQLEHDMAMIMSDMTGATVECFVRNITANPVRFAPAFVMEESGQYQWSFVPIGETHQLACRTMDGSDSMVAYQFGCK